jgi:tetratricopeptide (TPR) repeat protein
MGQPELAEADFTQVLEWDKGNAFALARRGAARLEMGQSKLAEADFTQVLEWDKDNTFALAYRGVAHREMKQYEKALADLTKAHELGYSREWVIKAIKELEQRRR